MTSLKTASLAEIREIGARICRDYLTGQWKTITAEDIVVKRISGGLSNLLYYISLPQDGSNSSTSSPIKNLEKTTQPVKSIFHKRNLSNEIDNDEQTGKRQRTNSGEINFTSSGGLIHKEPREVLLRVYGQTHGENALEAMITESVVFALLSERNFGPKLHGIFPGGRIEQYIPARALVTAELADHKISMKIAEKMGEIHSLNIPMSKEPDWLWNCMDRWLKGMNNVLKNCQSKDLQTNVNEIRSFDFLKEKKWLKSIIDGKDYPVLFCHNDLQEGNILLRKSDQKCLSASIQERQNSLRQLGLDDNAILESRDQNANAEVLSPAKKLVKGGSNNNNNDRKSSTDQDNTQDSVLSTTSEEHDPDLIIIDFEYCAYNYRGFDLANHFIEWTIDYSNPEFPNYFYTKKQYPSKQQRYDFIKAYLRKLNESVESYVPSDSEIEAVDEEVRIFSMFSHFLWTLWSLVNVTSTIEFGYWQYAITRLREYKELKQEYLLRQ